MGTRQYIGARYVPKFYENSLGTAEWQAGVIYEPLTIVTYNRNSYTSKRNVPANVGNPSANAFYWVATGNYNEQINELQNDVNALQEDSETLKNQVNWYTPEMFGAVGDGTTDDSQAFIAMLAAVSAGDTIVLTKNKYKVNSPLTINKHDLKIIGFGKSEQYNTIVTDLVDGAFITVSTYGVTFDSIGVMGVGYDTTGTQILIYFNCDDTTNVGNIDATLNNCAIAKTHIGVASKGRNVEIRGCIFSQCFYGFEAQPCTGGYECRGHIVQGCRIHGCGIAFHNAITSAHDRKNVLIDSNFIDASGGIFKGYSAGVIISNNLFDHYSSLVNYHCIELTQDPLTTHSEPCVVENNAITGGGMSGTGILVNTGVYVRIHGNTLSNIRYDGIGLAGTAVAIVDSNFVDNCGQVSGRYNFSIASTVTGALTNNVNKSGTTSGGTGMTSDGNITLT